MRRPAPMYLQDPTYYWSGIGREQLPGAMPFAPELNRRAIRRGAPIVGTARVPIDSPQRIGNVTVNQEHQVAHIRALGGRSTKWRTRLPHS